MKKQNPKATSLELGDVAHSVIRPQWWHQLMATAPKSLQEDVRKTLESRGALDQVRIVLKQNQIQRRFATDIEILVVRVLAGAAHARDTFNDLRTKRRRIAIDPTTGEITLEGAPIFRRLGDKLRHIGRRRARGHQPPTPELEHRRLRDLLAAQNKLDRAVRDFYLGKKTQPEKIHLKTCAQILTGFLLWTTRKPQYWLIGWLMLTAGLLGDSACRPWETTREYRAQCRAYPPRCPVSRCRRAEEVVKKFGRR